MNEQKALKYIKHVLIVGIIVGMLFGLNIISAFMMFKRSVELKVIHDMMTRTIIGICILFGMTWGVYKKRSRLCAIFLFSISIFFFILLVIYFNGVRATIYYHNKIKNNV